MREIKFRAWSKVSGKMIPSEEVKNETIDWLNTDGRWIPLQFTYIKDKNGKEIYEGDIVKSKMDAGKYVYEFDDDVIGFIEWRDVYAGLALNTKLGLYNLRFLSPWPHEWDCKCNLKHFNHTVEVIGNIYENPELINKEGENGVKV